jgi:AcrR family transcriptional regulator
VSTVNRRQQSDLTARLVDAAAALLAEHGPGGLSLRKLAAEVGISTMPVYTLFSDKAGLLAAMYEEGFRRLADVLEAVPHTDNPLADLIQLGLAYRQAAQASPHLYGLMFGRAVPEFRPDDTSRAIAHAAYQPLVTAVARCQQSGVFTGAEPERIALHLWAISNGMVGLELNGQLPTIGDPDELYLEALAFAGMPFLGDAASR